MLLLALAGASLILGRRDAGHERVSSDDRHDIATLSGYGLLPEPDPTSSLSLARTSGARFGRSLPATANSARACRAQDEDQYSDDPGAYRAFLQGCLAG
jgi:hypothetical protein